MRLGFLCIGFIVFSVILASFCDREYQTNPSVNEIMQSHIIAKGGMDNLKKVKTFSITMVDAENEIMGESFRAFPDKLCDILSFHGSKNKTVLNGDSAFLILADTSMPITNTTVLNKLREDAMIFPELYPETLGHRRTFAGEEWLNGVLHYIIAVKRIDNSTSFYYYDSKTWLLSKIMDEKGMQLLFSDYRDVSGIKIFHESRVISERETLTLKVTQVNINPNLDEALFEIK